METIKLTHELIDVFYKNMDSVDVFIENIGDMY